MGKLLTASNAEKVMASGLSAPSMMRFSSYMMRKELAIMSICTSKNAISDQNSACALRYITAR